MQPLVHLAGLGFLGDVAEEILVRFPDFLWVSRHQDLVERLYHALHGQVTHSERFPLHLFPLHFIVIVYELEHLRQLGFAGDERSLLVEHNGGEVGLVGRENVVYFQVI